MPRSDDQAGDDATEQPQPQPGRDELSLLLDYIEKHAARIYVRAKVAGKFGNHPLTKLPAAEAIGHVCRFIREREIPFHVIREDK
jgi:hypothetical protein